MPQLGLPGHLQICVHEARQQRVEEEDAQQSEVREAETKMTVYTVLTFLGQLFCTLYLVGSFNKNINGKSSKMTDLCTYLSFY